MNFGYDPANPLPALLRVAGLGIALYGLLTDNMAAFVVGLVVGFAGILIGWSTPAKPHEFSDDELDRINGLTDAEFEQQADDYENGRRDTLPGL